MQYSQQCTYIYQKRPQTCSQLKAAGDLLCCLNDGRPLNNGILKARTGIYSCMSYDKRRVIALITDGPASEVINLIFKDDSEYKETLRFLKDSFGLNISVQDCKLISYARNISEKLRIGVEVKVFDAQSDDDFVICPECGVKNHKDSGMPFCLECGAAL